MSAREITLPIPDCNVCSRPVEALHWDEDPAMREFVLVAECHGERDRCRIPVDELHDLLWHPSARVVEAVAFRQQINTGDE